CGATVTTPTSGGGMPPPGAPPPDVGAPSLAPQPASISASTAPRHAHDTFPPAATSFHADMRHPSGGGAREGRQRSADHGAAAQMGRMPKRGSLPTRVGL